MFRVLGISLSPAEISVLAFLDVLYIYICRLF